MGIPAACEAERIETRQLCGLPGSPHTVGCIHEHVRQLLVCDEHVRLSALAILRCKLCGEHPTDPHDCAVVLARAGQLPVPVQGHSGGCR